MHKFLLTLLTTVFVVTATNAQHEHHSVDKTKRKAAQKNGHEGNKMPMPEDQETPDSSMKMGVPMSHAFSLNLPMNRNGSGTGWLPDASPMYGVMLHSKKWMYMIHGSIFLRYNKQDIGNKGVRGGEKWDAPNWLMAMGQRKVGERGLFRFSAMVSLDAPIAGGSGYPLLFQSGESWKGQPLVDRQHPHDLFSELSIGYTYAISKKVDVFGYFGYPGEPTLGSVAFMHRPSALPNPDAPLSHHWNDGTHITFGVATLGIRLDKFKLEGSSFTGREPDEDRYNFDKARFDSWSGRLSYNPTANWAFQVGHGYIKSPEALHGEEDVHRTTTSAVYSLPMKHEGSLNVTALWGLNKTAGHDGEHAVLLEGALQLRKLAIYSRYEWVQKSTEELDLDETIYGHDAIFPVHALTAGLNYTMLKVGPVRLATGGHLSFYHADKKLDGLYGKNPIGGQLYIRIYPNLMRM
ncbi:hypothetical protein [Paraflavitalea speifideaquila]|uniref:hypothetical protein n=1 Tax=Paraflavitalea speifideaquila TaxID=3076558 RepID=UPI0028E83A24|nr:hypothetical protein [Paraflavitalea speifideiaquila]